MFDSIRRFFGGAKSESLAPVPPPPVVSHTTKLIPIVPALDPRLDVVFVHGLDGDAMSTWRFDAALSWHAWIANHRSDVNVWSLSYRLKSTKLAGGSMPLPQRAVNVLATLEGPLSGGRPIIFVCHSYGGLVAKKALQAGATTAQEYGALVERVKGISFFATPHAGSDLATFVDSLSRFLPTEAIKELRDSDAYLQDLNIWFRNNAPGKWKLRIYFETMKTGPVQIVTSSSADPGIAGVTPHAVDADHLAICKPTEADFRVHQLLNMIDELLGAQSPPQERSFVQQILAAETRVDLTRIEEEIEEVLRRNPNDQNAIKGRRQFDRMRDARVVHMGKARDRVVESEWAWGRDAAPRRGMSALGIGLLVLVGWLGLSHFDQVLAAINVVRTLAFDLIQFLGLN